MSAITISSMNNQANNPGNDLASRPFDSERYEAGLARESISNNSKRRREAFSGSLNSFMLQNPDRYEDQLKSLLGL